MLLNKGDTAQNNYIFLNGVTPILTYVNNDGECYERTCRTVSSTNADGSTTEYKACGDWVRVQCPSVTPA